LVSAGAGVAAAVAEGSVVGVVVEEHPANAKAPERIIIDDKFLT
jgi:hypothetical protein